MNYSPFGDYIRRRRIEARISMRSVADKLGVSHVYLGEVERGERRKLHERHWAELMKIIPGLKLADLQRFAHESEGLDARVATMPENRQRDIYLLARRIEEKDIEPNIRRKILDLLGIDEDE